MRWRVSIVAMSLVVAACTAPAGDPAEVATTESIGDPAIPTTTEAGGGLRAVILDYSPTVSDIGALAFLATHPDVFLIAVTLAGTGETDCEPGVAMTLGILEFLDRSDVPVACGQPDPISGQNAFPADRRLSPSDLDVDLAEPTDDRSASELIGELVRASPIPVDIVAVGPLTNLAVAFAVDPELASLVGGITVMGGAIDVSGTVAANEVAEWNMWIDPVAASDVLRSGAAVTLVPLDATNSLPTGSNFFDALDAQATSPAARLVRDLWLAHPARIDNHDGAFFFWDELAAATLVDESLVTFESKNLVVELADVEIEGWTREDSTGSRVRVVTSVQRLAFERLFLQTLVGGPADLTY